MSRTPNKVQPRLEPRHDHGHEENVQRAPHGTLREYLTGFAFAAVLTVIPFWLVMGHVLHSTEATIALVLVLGVVQILVHMRYFLHMNTTSEGGWNMLSLILTLVLVVIVLGASLWVVYNENVRMMPMSPIYARHTQNL